MEERWGRVVFLADGLPYAWDDVVEHARSLGTWALLERETADGLLAADRADAAGAVPSRDEVRTAEAGFRHARRLLAAEDMERWLAQRQVSLAEWRAWVGRELCRRVLATRGTAATPDVGDAVAPGPDATWVTGWCSGILEGLAHDFADRVAAQRALADAGVELGLEEAYERLGANAAGDAAIRGCVAAHLLDWMALDCDWLSLSDEDTAREGLMYLREDGFGMDELADAVGGAVVRRHTVIADLDHGVRLQFLSSREGDHLGPLPVDGGVAIVAVRAKVMPSADDDEVRRRAGQLLVDRAVDRETERRVRWHEPL